MQKENKFEEWLKLALEIHGNRYDYSQVKFINSKTPVIVICKIHGSWNCTPSSHIDKTRKRGCPVCGGSQKKTSEQFIEEANIKHDGAYDYSNTKYINSHTNVEIICPLHGSFNQSPTSHLSGRGCSECAKLKRTATETQNSLTSIKNRLHKKTKGTVHIVDATFTKVNAEAKFICEKHGEFTRIVNAALYRPNTCLECFKETNTSTQLEQPEAELNVKKKLKDGITYAPFFYEGARKTSVVLNCPMHGSWSVLYASIISNGVNCPKCVHTNAMPKRTASIKAKYLEKQDLYWDKYLIKFKEQHGETYDYSLASFINAKTPIKIKCLVHGEFEQTPDMHIRSGCRLCADEELAGLYSKRFFELKPELANVPASLYLLKLTWSNNSCYKIGITRTTLKRRFGAALGRGIHIEVLRVLETTLIKTWQHEVQFLSIKELKKFIDIEKEFARKSRISPSELFVDLPNNWESLIKWTMTTPYQLQ
jgi:hypothetical protein